ncbi:MAG: class I SAM-dependent methyltransferase [Rhizomicrobium sp.]
MLFTFDQTTRQVEIPDEFYDWSVPSQSGMMDANELLHLAAALASYDWSLGGFVLEIGAYWGSTAVFMARVLARLGLRIPILSIDPFERFQPDALNPSGVFAAYNENARLAGFSDLCLPLAAFSADAAAVVASNIGVLVIDGDHHYDAVSRDFELYPPKLNAGGFLFIDDTAPPYDDVLRAATDFFAADPTYEVLTTGYFTVAQKAAPAAPKKHRKSSKK